MNSGHDAVLSIVEQAPEETGTRSMNSRNLALAVLMSVIFGLGWILGKSALDQFPPVLMAAFRFGIAAMTICALTGWPKLGLSRLLPLSVLAISAPYSLSNIGLAHLDVSLTILLVQLEAPILICLSALFLGEKVDRGAVCGTILATAGVVLVAGEPASSGGLPWIGLVIFSIIVWATGQLWIRTKGISGSVSLLGGLAALATPQLFVLSAFLEPGAMALLPDVSMIGWMQVIYLGVVMTALGIGIWYYLIARFEVPLVAPFLLLVPAVSIAGGILLLSEEVSATRMIGAAVIMVGVALATFKVRGQVGPRHGSRTKESEAQ